MQKYYANPESSLINKELLAKIFPALDSRQQDILTMKIIQRFTYEEIAEKYDLSIERIKQIEKQALKILLNELKKLKFYKRDIINH